jgi:uncharacterized protein
MTRQTSGIGFGGGRGADSLGGGGNAEGECCPEKDGTVTMATDANTEPSGPSGNAHPGGPIYFACFTRRGSASLEDVESAFPAHKQWVADQEAAGKLVVAGPFLADDLSWDGNGMLIFRVDTIEEARRLALEDPMHALGHRTFEVFAWQLNEGSFRIALTFSAGAFEFE